MKYNTYIKYLAKKHKVKKEEIQLNIIEQYPYIYLQTFANLFYSLAIAERCMAITRNALKKLNRKNI